MEQITPPRLFISYSWTTPDHEAWVLQLATELRESGVDVILDKWDLREGDDAHAFMERMVTDLTVKKVLLICDKLYVERANGRSGGVGTETQIISGEIYAQQAQGKFVAVVRERDEEGTAFVPAYYRSRIYIDLSDSATYAANFDQLLRWIFDKPLYQKPDLGKAPAFLDAGAGAVTLGTTSRARRALDALRNNRDHALPATGEYLELLSTELEKLRLTGAEEPFDDAVVQSIDAFLPYRNEAIDVFLTLARYRDTQDTRIIVHRFFESAIPYLDRPPQLVGGSREWDFDNFRFVIHELFLYAVAAFIRHERFESAAFLMGTQYYLAGRSEYGRNAIVSFDVLRAEMKSLRFRNERLKSNRASIRADLLSQRATGGLIEFRQLMQADFVLFLRGWATSGYWFPETLLYAERHAGTFELFARSQSRSYFNRARVVLGVTTKDELGEVFQSLAKEPSATRLWSHVYISPAALAGFEEIATRP